MSQADHNAIKMSVSYKRIGIQTTLTFKNIEVVRIHLHTDPLFILVEPSVMLCRRLNAQIKAKFKSDDKMLLSAGSGMYVYMYVCMYVYMYVCMYMYICMYGCMYVCIYVCM